MVKCIMMKLNQKGISLVGVMIAMGLTAVMGLTVMRMSQTASKAQMSMKSSSDFIGMANIIQTKLRSKDYCEASFRNPGINLAFDDPNSDQIVNIPRLEKPIYDSNGDWDGTSSNPEYDVSIEAVQRADILLTSMFLIRSHEQTDSVRLELNFERRNPQSFGGKNLKKIIELTTIMNSSGDIVSCYSDYSNMVATAEKNACEFGLGGTYSLATNPRCKETAEYCELKKDILILLGQNYSAILCDKTFTIEDANSGVLTSGGSFTLPDNYVPASLRVSIVGGGGGGGCGRAYHGEGGKRGNKKVNLGSNDKNIAPGTSISYSIGSGGGGGANGVGNCQDGGSGETTTVTISGETFSAAGGGGGQERCDSCTPSGQGVYFAGTNFSGGAYRPNNHGLPGQTGSGGAGGEKSTVDSMRGGNGGSGAVYFEYKVWTWL